MLRPSSIMYNKGPPGNRGIRITKRIPDKESPSNTSQSRKQHALKCGKKVINLAEEDTF